MCFAKKQLANLWEMVESEGLVVNPDKLNNNVNGNGGHIAFCEKW